MRQNGILIIFYVIQKVSNILDLSVREFFQCITELNMLAVSENVFH